MYTGNERAIGRSQNQDDQPYSGIREAAPLPTILEGEIRETGEPVVLLQTCDWLGHSPSVVGVKNGQLFIASFNEVKVTDRQVRPPVHQSNMNDPSLSRR